MEFKIEAATPTKVVYANERGQKVVFMPTAKGDKILASGSLMKPQIDAVTAARQQGLNRVQVRDMVGV